MYAEVIAVVPRLALEVVEQGRVDAEVLVPVEALARLKRVVRLGREPLEVGDDGVDRKAVLPELTDDPLHVALVLPAPTGGDEAESVSRQHRGSTDERIVLQGPLGKRGRRHQVHLEVMPSWVVFPCDAVGRGGERDWHRILVGAVQCGERAVAVCGVVVGRQGRRIADDGCHRRPSRDLHLLGVLRAGPAPEQRARPRQPQHAWSDGQRPRQLGTARARQRDLATLHLHGAEGGGDAGLGALELCVALVWGHQGRLVRRGARIDVEAQAEGGRPPRREAYVPALQRNQHLASGSGRPGPCRAQQQRRQGRRHGPARGGSRM
mmetsp:Transcript_19019/g.53936  ORF Transcript_19019/g.53936 Transcript_19019/m.53936 type:complete len:322 (+) Transcript_19019:1381-2346(+)